ncbi:hypothetical protein [Pedobacter sp. BMA]|uniref:hypothetical protein n=1 Tax=Pedobacter sp. BMA TaxID=1663685 RepID=UPI00064AADB9|nr:hypothetical protein [Pedobacter sp. BMA]KLT63850.1 hypothetical protein AB669_19120 [Pedobacter sp. BMA]
MQPFNVKVERSGTCHLFTVLPKDSYYEIMSDDKIIGAIVEKHGAWEELPLGSVHTDDLELNSVGVYQKDSALPLPVNEIGKEINLILAGLPEHDQNDTCN